MSEIQKAIEHHKAGRLQQAEAIYRDILAREPDHAQALHLLGAMALQVGRHEAAAEFIARALAAKPDYAAAYNNLGLVRQAQGRTNDAVEAYQQALRIAPHDAEIWLNLGSAWAVQGSLNEAITAYKRALEFDPRFALAQNNLGVAQMGQGDIDEAIDSFRQALVFQPSYAEAHSNLFQCMHYSQAFDAETIYNEARRFNTVHARPLTERALPHDNDRSPERRLRIGYVSTNLRQHPVGFFFAQVFAHHDTTQFEVFCYAAVSKPDDITTQIRSHAAEWRDCIGMSDSTLAQQIRADGIDILIDLAGHSGLHRLLLVFAHKPAPVQVTAGGHYDTTGLDAIDYLISDRFHSPPGSERYFSETLVRMPHGYVCYAPPWYAPAVGEPPVLQHGHVTFGCFNNLAKVTPDVVALWSEILKAMPTARLRQQNREFNDPATRERYHARLTGHGIDPNRIDLHGHVPHRELLAAYGTLDIALDPFPYSGGLTTCEALWMGVPVVTLSGGHFASRHSTSHLANVGLTELITETREAYASTALALAQDTDRLSALRRTLREQMAASPLCDAARYTRELEAVYRDMWRHWCAQQTSGN